MKKPTKKAYDMQILQYVLKKTCEHGKKRGKLNGKFVTRISFNLTQMALPTIVFPTDSSFMKATPITCRR
jgi:hypothetical protein